MFGKQPEEIKQSDTADIEDVRIPSKIFQEAESKQQDDELGIQLDLEKPESVKIVEKISGIISPYFIVIVGLFLYEENFLIGTILIVIGIISLLKFSWKDVVKFLEEIKKFFGLT